MFETVLGLPAHPLLVHATVVFVPLLALGAAIYAVAPFLRARIRWVVVLLGLAGPATAWLAKLSGDAFRRRQAAHGVGAEMLAKIDQHKSFGDATFWAAIALGAVTLVLVLVTMDRLPMRRASGASVAAAPAMRIVRIVLIVATVGLAVASGYYVFKTGESGARMEWSGR